MQAAIAMVAKTYPKHSVSVTYDATTEQSAEDGDHADNGWVNPRDESQVSIGYRCRRNWYASRVKRAQAGEFDWKLRDAIRFLEQNGCGSYEGGDHVPYVRTQPGRGPYTETIRLVGGISVDARSDGYDIVCGRNGYEHGDSVSYSLHVGCISVGTAARLRRVLEANGVRFHNYG